MKILYAIVAGTEIPKNTHFIGKKHGTIQFHSIYEDTSHLVKIKKLSYEHISSYMFIPLFEKIIDFFPNYKIKIINSNKTLEEAKLKGFYEKRTYDYFSQKIEYDWKLYERIIRKYQFTEDGTLIRNFSSALNLTLNQYFKINEYHNVPISHFLDEWKMKRLREIVKFYLDIQLNEDENVETIKSLCQS